MELTDRRILVTGANGFVGARACRRLAEAGATVHALVRRAGTAPVAEGIVERLGDFTEPSEIAAVIDDVDDVLHTAAAAGPDWDAVRAVNTHGTRVIATATRVAGIRRFVHISTYSIYDRSGDVDVVTEDTPGVDPDGDDANPYSVTKLEAEQVLDEFTDDLDIVILRPPAVLGAGPTSTWGQKVPDGLRRGELLVPLPAAAQLFWIHVDDLVGAAVAGLTIDTVTSGRPYNVVAGAVVWEQYVSDLHAMLADPPPLPDFPDGRPATPATNADRLAAELGFVPSRSYEDALDDIRTGLA